MPKFQADVIVTLRVMSLEVEATDEEMAAEEAERRVFDALGEHVVLPGDLSAAFEEVEAQHVEPIR